MVNNQLSLFAHQAVPKDWNKQLSIPLCPNHPEFLPYIKTIDVAGSNNAQAKCVECNRHIKWLTCKDALELINICPTDDELDNITLRLTAIVNLPQTVDGWKQLTLKLWLECQEKGYKSGWVWHQLQSKQAPPEAFNELGRLRSANFN